jgi:NADH:ubiquinone oxidoreductase subunit 2 (subunit N)
MALYAITIPAFIAGSGINHLGFILIGIACDDTSGATSALLHLLNYTITSAAFFLIFLSLKK